MIMVVACICAIIAALLLALACIFLFILLINAKDEGLGKYTLEVLITFAAFAMAFFLLYITFMLLIM